MKKQNLSEEIYRMRKLMNFDSKEFNENTTSLDRLIEEKLRLKRLMEQETDNEDTPEFFDWSNGGKVNWENAKLKDIIKYIGEVDNYFGGSFLNNPAYTTMMDWYLENDSEDVRESLKNWMFGDIYYGIKKVEGVKQTKKNIVAADEYDKNLQTELTTILDTASKIDLSSFNVTDSKLKKSIESLISSRTLEKLNKELIAINNGKIFLKKEILEPLKSNLNVLIDYSKNPNSDAETIESLKDVAEYLISFKLKDKKEIGLDVEKGEVKIDVDANQRITIKNSLMKELGVEIEEVGEDVYKKLLKKITDIKITDNPKELNIFKVDKENKGVPIMEEGDSDIFQYPPENTPEEERNNLGNNFFRDDGTGMSQDANAGIREQVRLIRKFIQEQQDEVSQMVSQNNLNSEDFKLVVSSINIFIYSSTSKVRTTYKSKDKSFSEDNNIQLASDRSSSIEDSVRNALKQYKLDKYDIVLASRIEKPNIGPGWRKLDGKYADGSEVPISEYGAMFQEAYKKDKNLTPQLFYGNRTNSWAQKASKRLGREISQTELSKEYNDTYGPFRMNLAGISVSLSKPTIITKEEVGEDYFVVAVPGMGIQLQSNGEFSFKDTWRNLKRGIKKLKKKISKSLKKLKPRRRFFGKAPDFSKVCKTCCPKW